MAVNKLELVVPDLDGPVTGGTRFNRELVGALRLAGHEVDVRREPSGRGTAWVDTLFMDRVAAWSERGTVGLLTHWLPSLVRVGEDVRWEELADDERATLRSASAFVVPSPFMRDVLLRLGVDAQRVGVVEPGADGVVTASPSSDRLRVVLVGNVTEGKGVLELIETLQGAGGISLRLIGSVTADAEYAARAREAGAGFDVTFEGALPHAECLALIAESDVLVSASRMESYGMAIADARACGVPVLARAGGNVKNLVDEADGGELVEDTLALADALRRLAADRQLLARRRARARAHRRVRSWQTVQADFVDCVQRLG